ncbi:MAG TPA: acyl-CoA dehydrogenase, partial [Hyphomicrobiaceae bacterium]|nr:acyl-CoA dehydrogenase [Hyphomicrobiaceae bacterium]
RQGQGVDGRPMVPIIEHPDIRRSLLTMKALTQAARMICLATAREIDRSRCAGSERERQAAQLRAALLTPVAKAFSTDIGCEVASLGVQVHGGAGFIEETGAAQYYRDARILPIYEGTNGIQAIDLVTRKVPLEGGAVLAAYIGELERTVAEVNASNQPAFGEMGRRLGEAVAALKTASTWMGKELVRDRRSVLAGATPYLRLFGLAAGGVYLARAALAAVRNGSGGSTVAHARYFAENIATAAEGLAQAVTDGAQSILAVEPDQISA